MKKEILLTFFLLPLSQNSTSAEKNCPTASGIARTECLEKKIRSAESELKQVLAKALSTISAQDSSLIPAVELENWRKNLIQSQRSWTIYKKTECEEITPYFWWGGSGVTGAVLDCSLAKTEARIKELRERYSLN